MHVWRSACREAKKNETQRAPVPSVIVAVERGLLNALNEPVAHLVLSSRWNKQSNALSLFPVYSLL